MKIDKQSLLIVGQPVEAFSNKMHAGMVQCPSVDRFCALFSIAATVHVSMQHMAIRQATLPWPTAMRNDSLKAILQEN